MRRVLGGLVLLSAACTRDSTVAAPAGRAINGRTIDAGALRVSSVPLPDPDDVVSPAATRAVLEAHREELVRRCWNPVAGRADAPAVLHVTVRVTARFDGTTGEVTVLPREPVSGEFAACVQHEVEQWRFPRAEEATRLTIPLAFAR